jgi:hypothetical protein
MAEHHIAGHIANLRSILTARQGGHQVRPAPQVPDSEPEFCRSTSPDAQMNLLLRFETPSGPRTIVAPGVPLSVASEIVQEMARAGHFAQFLDQLTPIRMTEWIKRRKAEKLAARPTVVGLRN